MIEMINNCHNCITKAVAKLYRKAVHKNKKILNKCKSF